MRSIQSFKPVLHESGIGRVAFLNQLVMPFLQVCFSSAKTFSAFMVHIDIGGNAALQTMGSQCLAEIIFFFITWGKAGIECRNDASSQRCDQQTEAHPGGRDRIVTAGACFDQCFDAWQIVAFQPASRIVGIANRIECGVIAERREST